ncbi:MAG: DUF1330 domain-containing protein [Kiloniellaceae bacterium]
MPSIRCKFLLVEGSARHRASRRRGVSPYELAQACYEDPAYQEAKRFASKASKRDLLIFEGDLP